MSAGAKTEIEIAQVASPDQIVAARALFVEYAQSLNFNLCFQSFEQELAELPGKYAPPAGRLLLAARRSEYLGCVALRPLPQQSGGEPSAHPHRESSPGLRLSSAFCEMKRLYVRPAGRGFGLGRLLVEHLIVAATQIGYKHMRLDTVPGVMDHAIALYRELGFREIPPYCHNPMPGTLYFELEL